MAPSTSKNRKKKRAVPLAPPPHVATMKSRKKARQVTTLFHKYTRERDLAEKEGADPQILADYDKKIEGIGGREAYQKASQLSTSFHSTSKWVLGVLQRKGWLYGIPMEEDTKEEDFAKNFSPQNENETNTKRKRQRRSTKLLEVGAINTELLDAADRTIDDGDELLADLATTAEASQGKKKYRLDVRAIDLNSMHPERIEKADFLKLPIPQADQRFDVVVCSMVLNCVTTPADRGEMLARLYHFLRPGGLLFLTIPKLCLSQSPYIDRNRFEKLLGLAGVGFEMEETKESPKVAFFLCKRPEVEHERTKIDPGWSNLKVIHRGKKFRNKFSITLDEKSVLGKNLV